MLSYVTFLYKLDVCTPVRQIEQVAQLWQRDRERSAILRGWVTLKLNVRMKGYISRQYLWTARWGNGYTRPTTLPWRFSHKETL